MTNVTFQITRLTCNGVSDFGENDEVFLYLQADAGTWVRYPDAAVKTISMCQAPDDYDSGAYLNRNMGTDDAPVYCDIAPGSGPFLSMTMACEKCVLVTAMDLDNDFDNATTDYLGSACLMQSVGKGVTTMTNGTSSSYELHYSKVETGEGA